MGPRTDIYTHNPWGEYGHEEHIQVNHAMVALAQRHGCSVWAWDGLSGQDLVSQDVWLRTDYYPDEHLVDVPSVDSAVDLERFREIRALYQRHNAWTWHDDYLPPNPSRFLQIARDGEVLVSARHLPRLAPSAHGQADRLSQGAALHPRVRSSARPAQHRRRVNGAHPPLCQVVEA